MKTITRHKAFETNSSSTHSVCVYGQGAEEEGFEKFDKHHLHDIGSGEYGWEQETLYGFHNKLDYLHIYLDQTENMFERPAHIKNGRALLQWLVDEFKARGKEIFLNEVIPNNQAHAYNWGKGYIDHQSCPSNTMETEVLSSQKALLNFLFNDSCYFETDNDNH